MVPDTLGVMVADPLNGSVNVIGGISTNSGGIGSPVVPLRKPFAMLAGASKSAPSAPSAFPVSSASTNVVALSCPAINVS